MGYRIHRMMPIITSAGGGYDTDAQAFFTAAGITDSTQKSAVNQLVLDLKSASVWTKFQAIYPFVGGDATKHSYNLKAPASFQITWHGTITHDANGVTGDGSTGYGDTGWNESTNGSQDNEHLSVYSRTEANINVSDIGLAGASSQLTFKIRASGLSRCIFESATQKDTSSSTSLGYFSCNRTASSGYRLRQNATNTAITDTSVSGLTNLNVYLLGRNSAGALTQPSSRNYAWAAIGTGLTQTEDGNVQAAVQTFQTSLSRQV